MSTHAGKETPRAACMVWLMLIEPLLINSQNVLVSFASGSESMYCTVTDLQLRDGTGQCKRNTAGALTTIGELRTRDWVKQIPGTLSNGYYTISREAYCLTKAAAIVKGTIDTISTVEFPGVPFEPLSLSPAVLGALLGTLYKPATYAYPYVAECAMVVPIPLVVIPYPSWMKVDSRFQEIFVEGESSLIQVYGSSTVIKDIVISSLFCGKICKDGQGSDNFPIDVIDPSRTCAVTQAASCTNSNPTNYPNLGAAIREGLASVDTFGTTISLKIAGFTRLNALRDAEAYFKDYYQRIFSKQAAKDVEIELLAQSRTIAKQEAANASNDIWLKFQAGERFAQVEKAYSTSTSQFLLNIFFSIGSLMGLCTFMAFIVGTICGIGHRKKILNPVKGDGM